jgi:glycosyltransferase involved in cell wall biosynthesis
VSISVIIPNWNAGDLLRDAVMSVNGDLLVSEIIVVDNASTDGSADRLLELGLHKLRLIRNITNIGAAKARNIGVTE